MPKRKTTTRKQTRQQRKEELKKTGFKSWFEVEFNDVAKAMGYELEYEADRITYVIPETKRHYTPDWKIREGVYVETKGVLDLATRKKLLHFRDSNPGIKIYVLFENGNNKIKSGSKTTYIDWCVKHGFECADWKYGIPIGWLKQSETE